MLWLVMAMAIVVSPYFAWNLSRFGHWLPISGAIKSTFPRVVGDARNLGTLGLVTAVVAAGCAVGLLFGRAINERRVVLGVMTSGVLAHALYIVLFTDHNTHWSWYYVLGVLLATLSLCVLADWVSTRSRIVRTRAVATLVIACLSAVGMMRGWTRFVNSRAASHKQSTMRFLPPAAGERWEIQFAGRMERDLPPHAEVLVFDYPGYFAFFTSLRIVAADGLIDDYNYDAEIRRDGLGRYLASRGIPYYVGKDLDPPDSCRQETIFAPLSRTDVGSLVLCPADRLARTATTVQGVPAPDVALYRIREVAAPSGKSPPPMVKHGALW